MNSRISRLEREVLRRQGERDQIRSALEDTQKQARELSRLRRNLEDAQVVIQTVAQQTQAELEYHLSEMVTLALTTVFGEEAYEFRVEFVQRRGRTEADLLFVRGGCSVAPLAAAGGGAVDVASFALRVALWRLQRPRSRAVLILDEPFRYLSRDLQPRASQLLKELSVRLSLQFIMVSHNPELIEEADKVFRVGIRDGRSRVAPG